MLEVNLKNIKIEFYYPDSISIKDSQFIYIKTIEELNKPMLLLHFHKHYHYELYMVEIDKLWSESSTYRDSIDYMKFHISQNGVELKFPESSIIIETSNLMVYLKYNEGLQQLCLNEENTIPDTLDKVSLIVYCDISVTCFDKFIDLCCPIDLSNNFKIVSSA